MLRCRGAIGLLLAGLALGWGGRAQAQPSASFGPSAPHPPATSPAPGDAPVAPKAEITRVERTQKKGFVFAPSVQDPGAFRFGLGAFYDAIDPAVMYGFNVRIPQLTLDARVGLGKGWSVKGHINSYLITNELLAGVSYAHRFGKWSLEGSASVGVYIGKLGQLGFDALLVAPEYRPELTVGYDMGNIALSLRGSLLLMGPEQVRVGDTWGSFDNSNLFVGHSETVVVENTTAGGGVWYFGLGAMTTRAYYALWLLFPDSPGLYTYPRLVAGYEF